jgi:hypothetical protein
VSAYCFPVWRPVILHVNRLDIVECLGIAPSIKRLRAIAARLQSCPAGSWPIGSSSAVRGRLKAVGQSLDETGVRRPGHSLEEGQLQLDVGGRIIYRVDREKSSFSWRAVHSLAWGSC